jgi:hypothetical protein
MIAWRRSCYVIENVKFIDVLVLLSDVEKKTDALNSKIIS